MKLEKNCQNNLFLRCWYFVILLVFVTSCANTIFPHKTVSKEISWDNNEQNGGFIGFDNEGYGIITTHARDRYNNLITIYSTNFIPPLKINDGISLTPTNNFKIDSQHLSYFSRMNRWYKNKTINP